MNDISGLRVGWFLDRTRKGWGVGEWRYNGQRFSECWLSLECETPEEAIRHAVEEDAALRADSERESAMLAVFGPREVLA